MEYDEIIKNEICTFELYCALTFNRWLAIAVTQYSEPQFSSNYLGTSVYVIYGLSGFIKGYCYGGKGVWGLFIGY